MWKDFKEEEEEEEEKKKKKKKKNGARSQFTVKTTVQLVVLTTWCKWHESPDRGHGAFYYSVGSRGVLLVFSSTP